MNNLAKKLKLYRILTLLKLVPKFWYKSRIVAKTHKVSTVKVFCDMFECLLKYGSSEENYEQFHFFGNNHEYRNSFITWRRNMSIMYKFCTPESKELFLDKVRWNERFVKYVKRDWLYLKNTSREELIAFLNRHPAVIVKRIDGACGVGIDKYNSSFILNNDTLINSMLTNRGGVIEEAIENCNEIKQLNPTSLNTIRIVTCIDKNGVPQIVATAIRMGNGHNCTDNIVSGGIACCVNCDSGCICTDGMNVEGKFFLSHPKSGIIFKGFQIPNWDECVLTAKKLALEVPDARFVGWDIVVTENGIDVLEGNIPPGEELTELDLKGKYQYVMNMY